MNLVPVPFHGDTIYSIPAETPEKTQVAIRPTCLAIGVQYQAQLKRLRRQRWAEVTKMSVIAADGTLREMVFFTRRTFSLWLATIDADRLKDPVIADKITLYQCEAADTLDRYFFEDAVRIATPLESNRGRIDHGSISVVSALEIMLQMAREHESLKTMADKLFDAHMDLAGDHETLSAKVRAQEERTIALEAEVKAIQANPFGDAQPVVPTPGLRFVKLPQDTRTKLLKQPFLPLEGPRAELPLNAETPVLRGVEAPRPLSEADEVEFAKKVYAFIAQHPDGVNQSKITGKLHRLVGGDRFEQVMGRLFRDGLVSRRKVTQGIGRPKVVWQVAKALR